MTDWIEGFTRTPIAGKTGGTFVGSAPARLVVHRTEGRTVAGAVGAYRKNGTPPHFTVNPKTGERVQHIALNRSGYAMRNTAGGVETNRQGAIQIEIVGFSDDSPAMADLEVAWLGVDVLRPIQRAVGFGWQHPAFVGRDAGFIARVNAPQRMAHSTWLSFHGICGHQHVPENDHWDPGRLRIDAAIAFARGVPDVVLPTAPTGPKRGAAAWTAPAPSAPDYATLRRELAKAYLASAGDLPVPMSPDGAPLLATIWLQRVLNLVFPEADLAEDGDYGPKTANVVALFQATVNRLQPGAITDAFPGVISNQTKVYLAVALRNIKDGKA